MSDLFPAGAGTKSAENRRYLGEGMRTWLAMLLAAVLAAASIRPVAAEDYPSRAITVIVPFPAGG
ncbi:MAG: hypothetical protein KGM94_14970, partial [Bradyrhizobium sp.]|nr:hypothetical protein [Bradyrhizobium sp.]